MAADALRPFGSGKGGIPATHYDPRAGERVVKADPARVERFKRNTEETKKTKKWTWEPQWWTPKAVTVRCAVVDVRFCRSEPTASSFRFLVFVS